MSDRPYYPSAGGIRPEADPDSAEALSVGRVCDACGADVDDPHGPCGACGATEDHEPEPDETRGRDANPVRTGARAFSARLANPAPGDCEGCGEAGHTLRDVTFRREEWAGAPWHRARWCDDGEGSCLDLARLALRGAESYGAMGLEPVAEMWVWTEHTGTCPSCGRTFRISEEAIAEGRRGGFDGTDAEVAAGIEHCIACIAGSEDIPGEIVEPERPELSYDGRGINGPDEYRSRLATFTSTEAAIEYGPLFEAAPMLRDACARVLRAIEWATTEDRLTAEEQASVLRDALAAVDRSAAAGPAR